ncbi:hypothetical protein GZ78_23315 [Endozoicomonas numazuensis]|uniref:Uncharacterized protein n=1 Tax=Endozoicomonas numazuensis TaxID=1137799 RepID=A0A081NCK4_9GAMM|nr:hypothetical protein GZ78_23315 [Endozoicomonas numazuensis]
MTKNPKLARAVNDAGLGLLRQFIEYATLREDIGCSSFPTIPQPRYIGHFDDQGQRKKGCSVVI